jgi:hypothetical protein
MSKLDLPIRAAKEAASLHGCIADRCDILQDGSTLVLRLTESLVARVVTDLEGPRKGSAWFIRENAVAQFLAGHGAPVIPMHPELPPGPHEHLGYTLNFWQFVTRTEAAPEPSMIGKTLYQCHHLLQDFTHPLPELGILHETRSLLEILAQRELFPRPTLSLLDGHLEASLTKLACHPLQPLHGDAHPGNLMQTTQGLLWTDWEDTFSGPIEWDLASIIWNARILENDNISADAILHAYQKAGGTIDHTVLHQCLIARAAVMSAWYPILYPSPSEERRAKLQMRLDWLSSTPQ